MTKTCTASSIIYSTQHTLVRDTSRTAYGILYASTSDKTKKNRYFISLFKVCCEDEPPVSTFLVERCRQNQKRALRNDAGSDARRA